MKLSGVIMVAAVIVVCLIAVVLALVLLRLRRMRSSTGFMCSYRPTLSAGWAEGFCLYGRDSLLWYRAIALSWHPDRTWSRSSFDPASFVARPGDDGRDWGEVAVTADGHRFYLFLERQDFNGLLSWSQAGLPQAPRVGLVPPLDQQAGPADNNRGA